MLNKDLIDLAYEIMNENLSSSKNSSTTISFKSIVDGVKNKPNIDEAALDANIGAFYVDLLQDNRFVFMGNDQWTLKEKITNELYKRNQNSLYNFLPDSDVLEEAYDEEALPLEMVNADNEVYEEETNEISRDSFSDSEIMDTDDFEDASMSEEVEEIVDDKE